MSRNEDKQPVNRSFGTQLPTSQSLPSNSPSGAAERSPAQPQPPQVPASPAAFGTFSPPRDSGRQDAMKTAEHLPDHSVFSSVFKTSGSYQASITQMLDTGLIGSVADNGDSMEQKPDGANSDWIGTVDLREEAFPHDPSGQDTWQRTLVSPIDHDGTIQLSGGESGGFGEAKRSPGGKSTWQLQIRERSLKGYVSGVRNRIPQQADEADGFLAAFVDRPDVAEYEVLKELGKGNMGIVYEARQSCLNRELAIKSLNPKESAARYEQEMFVSEAVVTANLVHPNIVPIHDLGRTDDGKLFYSMKKVTGVSWDKSIRERSLEENLDIFMKVCDAVAYAHSRGVINRDLKPENVVIGNYGEVIVLDWGLAVTNELFPKPESILLDYRGGAGTPVYMAPELVSDDISMVGNHSDIYLLGAILFEVLEGFPPHLLRSFWTMQNPHEQFASIVTAVMTNQIEQNVAHPGELMDIAFKAMATNVNDRFQSVEDLQDAIRQYRITGHAEEFYKAAIDPKKEQTYDNYQSSVALFDEAMRKWPGNQRAYIGDRLAREGFAKLALKKGDFDLGLHVIENYEGEEFEKTRKSLLKSRRRRTLVKRTWTVLAVGIVILAGGVLGLTSYALEQTKIARTEKEEAESAKAEANVAVAQANQAEEKQAAAEEATRLAQLEKERVEEQKLLADKAKAEAEKGKLAADQAKMEAEKAKAEAEKAAMLAAKDLLKAKSEITVAEKAKQDADKAAQEAMKAALAAEQAKLAAEKVLSDAVVAKQEAEKSLLETEWNKFNLQFDLFLQLGKFEDAYGEIENAIAKANLDKDDEGYNENFRKRRRNILQRKRDLEKSRAEQVKQLDDDVTSAVVGKSAQVIAFATPTKVEILVAGEEQQGLAGMKAYPRGGIPARVNLEISPDEKFVVATGRRYKRLWSIKDGVPRDFDLRNEFAVDESPSVNTYKIARFSADGRHLYIISDDEKITLEIYDLTSGLPTGILRTSIAGKSNNSFIISDFFLLPADEQGVSQLVYLTETSAGSTCKNAKVTWKDGVPSLDSVVDRKGLPRPLSADGNVEKMQALIVSPDYQRLAVRVGTKSVEVYERTDDALEFPFRVIDSEKILIECDTTISSVAFAADGNRLLLGTQDGYFEVWDWNAGEQRFQTYQAANGEELWQEHRIGGLSASPTYCMFVGSSNDQVLAVGPTDFAEDQSSYSVIRWNLKEYSNYRDPIVELGQELFRESLVQQTEIPALGDAEVAASLVQYEPQNQEAGPAIDWSALQYVGLNQDAGAGEEEKPVPRRWRVSRSAEGARFSMDGQRILVAADDRAAHVYARDKATIMFSSGRRSKFYEPRRNVFEEGHIPELSEILFLPPNGQRLLTKDFFGSVSVWDSVRDKDGFGREVSRVLASDFGISASPDGKWVFAAAREEQERQTTDGTLELEQAFVARLWSTADFEASPTPEPTRTFRGKHDRLITAVAVSPSSNEVVTADRRGKIVVWDLHTGEVIAELTGQHGNDQISGIAFLNDIELISTGFDGSIQRWLLKQDQLVAAETPFQFQRSDSRDDYIITLLPSPDRKRFATISVRNGGFETVMNEEKGAEEPRRLPNLVRLTMWTVTAPKEPLDLVSRNWPESRSEFDQGIAWTNDGTSLAHIYPIEVQSGEFVSELAFHSGPDWSVSRKLRPTGLTGTASKIAFSPQADPNADARIATFDGRIAHLWKLSDGSHLAEFRSHEKVYSADFSADRKLVATASDSLRIFVGDERSENHGSTVMRLANAHLGRVDGVQFTRQPASYRFVTLGGDAKVKIWDWNWAPGEEVQPPAAASTVLDLTPAAGNPGMSMDDTLRWTSSLKWSNDESLIAVTFGGEFYLFQRKDGEFKRLTLNLPEGITAKFNCCSIARDGRSVAAGGVRLLPDGRTLQSFGAVWTLREDAAPLLAATFDGSHAANINSSRIAGMTAVQFGPDGLTLLTGGTDGSVFEWDWDEREDESESVPSAEQFDSYDIDGSNPHGTSTVTSIEVSETGDIISSGSDGYIAFWPAVGDL